MVLVIVTTLVSMSRDPFDVAGELPPAPTTAPVTAGIPGTAGDDWLAYGDTGYGERYSSLTEITPQTVTRLETAWTFHTGDPKGPSDPVETTFEVTPLKVGDTLYLCTVHDHVIALDAASGQERWHFDPKVQVGHTSQHLSCRGLAYHDDVTDSVSPTASVASVDTGASATALISASVTATGPSPLAVAAPDCARRIFILTIDARLIALDAASGAPCNGFGADARSSSRPT